jgi:hypothetical protein
MRYGRKGRPSNCWMGATKGALGVLLFVGGCTGYIQPPATQPAPGPNPSVRQCPAIPAAIAAGTRPGMRFANVALTCGGNGGLLLSISTAPGGATRFIATLADRSVLDAVAIPVDGFGNDIIPTTGIHITFGLQYTGDQGVEMNAASSPCITQSKVTYTQFDTGGNLLIAAFEGTIKDIIHQTLDDAVIRTVFNISPSRCVRWRQMP